MKRALIRIILATVIVAGFAFEKWYVGTMKPAPAQFHFHSYLDVRDWNDDQFFLLGEWVSTSLTNETEVVKRETVIHGLFGDAIWLPVPAWLGAIILNLYIAAAIWLALLVSRDLTSWYRRRGGGRT